MILLSVNMPYSDFPNRGNNVLYSFFFFFLVKDHKSHLNLIVMSLCPPFIWTSSQAFFFPMTLTFLKSPSYLACCFADRPSIWVYVTVFMWFDLRKHPPNMKFMMIGPHIRSHWYQFVPRSHAWLNCCYLTPSGVYPLDSASQYNEWDGREVHPSQSGGGGGRRMGNGGQAAGVFVSRPVLGSSTCGSWGCENWFS